MTRLIRWLRKSVGLSFVLLVTVCLFTVSMINLYWTAPDTRGSYFYVHLDDDLGGSSEDSCERPIRLPADLPTVRDLAHRILAVSRNLRVAASSLSSPNLKDILELNDIALKLYPPIDVSMTTAGQSSESVVCPEEYLGSEMLDEAWKTMINCTSTSKLIQSLVTVLIVVDESPSNKYIRETQRQLMADFENSYPEITTVIVGKSKFNWSWKVIMESLKTPYVLVAPDLFRFSKRSSLLERLVRVLNGTPGVAAVGGAFRNATGHWSVGCFQTHLQNYALTYKAGYDHSYAECMFCDYVDGPFVIRTRLLRGSTLDTELRPEMRFADLFLALSQRYVSMSCPDVMFYANGHFVSGGATSVRTTWLSFVRKWGLNRILLDHHHLGRVLHRFTCTESGVRCDDLMSSAAAYTMPTCCREQMAVAYDVFATFCRNHSIGYYYDSGTALGAVKMSDVIPWDIDGDAVFNESNYSFIRNSAQTFEEHGLSLTLVTSHSSKRNSLFHMWTPDVFVEFYGENRIPLDRIIGAEGPLMEVRGFWIRGPVNPGMYARGRYGRDCLRHAQSWRYTDARNSFDPYVPTSTFAPCPRPFHHSCLDRFPVDGSIPFQVPEW